MNNNVLKILISILIFLCSSIFSHSQIYDSRGSNGIESSCQPTDVDGLIFWIRADSNISLDVNSVNHWLNIVNSDDTLLQNTASAKPTFVNSSSDIKNHPTIYFDGSNDFLEGGDILDIGENNRTVILVGKTESVPFTFYAKSILQLVSNRYALTTYGSTTELRFFYHGASQHHVIMPISGNDLIGNYKIYTTVTDRVDQINKLYLNTELKGEANNIDNSSYNFDSDNRFILGAHNNGLDNGIWTPLKGEIAEMIVYNNALNDSMLNIVFQYLQSRYSETVDLGEDIDIAYGFDDTTLNAGVGFSNYFWSTGETSQSIIVNKPGKYWVQCEDNFGFLSSDTINVTYPDYSLSLTDTVVICLYDSVLLKTNLNAEYYTINWSTGDVEDSIYIKSNGDYWAEISDTSGNIVYSDTVIGMVDSLPYYVDLGNDTSFCSGNQIAILPFPSTYYQEYLSNLSFEWSNGLTDSIISIDTSGQYNIQVTNINLCKGFDTIEVNITGVAPIANFESDTICFGDSTHFTDLSIETSPYVIDQWNWDFGDGSTSTAQHPTYLFGEAGTYVVTLNVSTAGNCEDSYTDTVIVKENPVAAFSVEEYCVGIPFEFFDQSTPAVEDSIVSWLWDFGDSFNSTQQTPTHIYENEGVYEVSLTVSTILGCSDQWVYNLEVFANDTLPDDFELISPANNSIMVDSVVDFYWDVSNYSSYYHLLISSDSLFEDSDTIKFLGNTSYQLSMTPMGSYYWKVLSVNNCNDTTESDMYRFHFFNPSMISDLQLWLCADAKTSMTGGFVNSWTNIIGNDTLKQDDIDNMPIYIESSNEINNRASIYFDGIDDYLNGGDLFDIGKNSKTFVIIAKANNTPFTFFSKSILQLVSHRYGITTYGSDTELMFFYQDALQHHAVAGVEATNILGNYALYTAITDRIGQKNSLIINNVIEGESGGVSDTTYDFNSEFDFLIGAHNNSTGTGPYFPLNGEIAELIIYNQALNDSLLSMVSSYLQYKYSPPVNLGANKRFNYDICADTIDAGERFRSYLWNTGDTTSFITVNQSGKYWVDVIDVFGFHSSDTVMVEFPDVAQNDISICLGDSTLFEIDLIGDYIYSWSNGFDGTAQYLKDEGEYWLKVTDTIGCFLTDTFYLDVDSFEVQASLGEDRPFCLGDSLSLIVGGDNAQSFIWSNGETTSSIIISETGTYSVTATSINGCVAYDTVVLSFQGYRPNAEYSNSLSCDGAPVNFTDESSINGSSPISDWLWRFSPLDSSTAQNPAFTFDSAGYYQVSLEVETQAGCIDVKTKTVTVYSYPETNFFPYQGCSSIEINFRDASTNKIGTVNNWSWNFDDPGSGTSNTSNLQEPIHVFETSGQYNVQLISANEAGCADTAVAEVDIKESPQVNFTNNEPCFGELAYFADSTITQPWNEIFMRKWDFGDGDTSNSITPSHLYESTGTYTVTYTAYAINGCNITITDEITVHANPIADFAQEDFCSNELHQFTNSSTIEEQAYLSYIWQIEDSVFAYTEHPYFSLQDSGFKNILLKAISEFGCEDSILKQIQIYPAPKADFEFEPEFGSAPIEVEFSSVSSGASNYFWDFGDNNTVENQEIVSFTFENNGEYPVKLIALNEFGCSDTLEQILQFAHTDADVAINDVFISEDNGYWIINCEVVNAGTRRLTNLDLFLQGSSSLSLKESWQGLLEPGNVMSYEFNSKINISNYVEVDFICVEAQIPEQIIDNSPSNNKKCKAINEDEFKLKELFPNPVKELLYIRFILPRTGVVKIEMFDAHGGLMGEYLNNECEAGLNTKTLSTVNLRNGVYTIRFTYGENIEVRRFVKSGQ